MKRISKKPYEPAYFFGYGSLLQAPGINGRGMLYQYKHKDLIPVRLTGYRRGMSACFRGRNFYGLMEDKECSVNGVIFPCYTKHDYRALLINEGALKAYGKDQVYWTTRVTDKIEILTDQTIPTGWRIQTLICKEDKTGYGRVSPWYIELCDRYADRWGEDFYNEFLATGGVSIKQWNNRYAKLKELEASKSTV